MEGQALYDLNFRIKSHSLKSLGIFMSELHHGQLIEYLLGGGGNDSAITDHDIIGATRLGIENLFEIFNLPFIMPVEIGHFAVKPYREPDIGSQGSIDAGRGRNISEL